MQELPYGKKPIDIPVLSTVVKFVWCIATLVPASLFVLGVGGAMLLLWRLPRCLLHACKVSSPPSLPHQK